jgi:flagellar biogenesis protein FliO
MRATTICLIFCCLAPSQLAAADNSSERQERYAAAPARQTASGAKSKKMPRRLPAPAAEEQPRSIDEDPESQVERAAFAEHPATAEGAGRSPPAKSSATRALRPRGAGKAQSKEGQANERARPLGAASSAMTGVASLAVVLGLFFAVAWAMRRGMPAGPALLPREAVEVLGRTPLAGRQQAHLVRCGNKVLLVHLSQGAAETLTEITDPLEVDRLVGLCRQAHPQSTTASFRQILQQFGREKRPTEA